jgi:uncharacterized protein (TIGR02271 family)
LEPIESRERIPVVHEQLEVGRETVTTGRVRVRKEVRERIAHVEAPVVHDRVTGERVPVGREVDPRDPPRGREEGDTLVVPVLEEVVVVEKRLVLREELRLVRVREESRVVHEVPLVEEQVVVERERESDVNP